MAMPIEEYVQAGRFMNDEALECLLLEGRRGGVLKVAAEEIQSLVDWPYADVSCILILYQACNLPSCLINVHKPLL